MNALALALITCAGVLSGCQGPPGRSAAGADFAQTAEQESARLRAQIDRLRTQSPTQRPAPARSPAPRASRASTVPLPPAGGSPALRASFDVLAAQLGGSEGLAFTSVGAAATTRLGSWTAGVGWSTVKVPLVVAVVAKARGHPDAGVQALMRRAITASDNAAAEQLWSSLGPPRDAASQVQAVLRSAGDGRTRAQSQRVRPGFTAFGQTN